MKPAGNPPPARPPLPTGSPTRLLDHAPPLLTLPSSHVGGGSYHEMLSQLGHHLEDLGAILVAHTVGHDVLQTAATTASANCCWMPHPKEGRTNAAVAHVDSHSVLPSRTLQTKALQAVKHEIHSHLLTVKEQERNNKLWELLRGTKNLPPPLSPWLCDPAIITLSDMQNGMQNGTPNAKDRGSVRGVSFDSWPTVASSGLSVDCHSSQNINKEKEVKMKSSPCVTLPLDFQWQSSPRSVTELESKDGKTKASPYQNESLARPEGLDAFLSRKTCVRKKQEKDQDSASDERNTVQMLRNVAKQASNARSSTKKLLIGNGRQARQYQRKLEKEAAMKEHQNHLNHEEKYVCQIQDSLVAVVILANALVMGISVDIEWAAGWETLEYLFTAFFLIEMISKMRDLGIKNYFFGSDWSWNMFDFVVVLIALIDLTIAIVLKISNAGNSVDLSKFTAVKMARLGRLARLIRLLRFKMFKQLKAMVTGVFAGLHVLMWAIILFFAFIFFLAMVLRNIYLDSQFEYMNEAFGTTPWAMFTLFRCFTDGCSAHDGTPLIVHFYERYGAYFVICYMLVFLFVTIGLFNLIMAIFVDNVMDSTKTMKKVAREANHQMLEGRLRRIVMKVTKRRYKHLLKKREAGEASVAAASVGAKEMSSTNSQTFELDDEAREIAPWAVRCVPERYPRLRFIVTKVELVLRRMFFCVRRAKEEKPTDTENYDFLPKDEDGEIVIDRELFNMLIEDPQMEDMMEQLELFTANRWELFDVLDADMSGSLGMEELIVGFMNLRGPTEKSDVVAALLCVRNTQQMVRDIEQDQEEFAFEAMSELSAILTGVQIMARFLLLGSEDADEDADEQLATQMSPMASLASMAPRGSVRRSIQKMGSAPGLDVQKNDSVAAVGIAAETDLPRNIS